MNLNVEKNLKIIFDKFFRNQHPESALRYLPIVKILKKKKLTSSKILEVGSGSLGITPYLKKEIDGIDVNFSGPTTTLLNKIKSTAINLPFRKNSYDVVISTDTLEHLPKDDRKQAISEILRVAKIMAIIIVPTGKQSEIQDKYLSRYYQKTFGQTDQFLSEHVKYGLPRNEEILVGIHQISRDLGKNAKIESRPLLNLTIRKILMKTWISKNKYIYYTYMKGFLLILPLLKVANFGNCYRRMFVIEFESIRRH